MTEQQNQSLQYQAFLRSPQLLRGKAFPEISLFTLDPGLAEGALPKLDLPANLVFGKRMEIFFSHYIQSSIDYRLLAENLQVIQDKITLGELDFLLKENATGQIVHVEMAFKFYLYVEEEGPDELSKWVGPNRRDRLSLKLKKLKERQFPLLHRPETQAALQNLGIHADEVQQRLCLNGLLFLPFAWREQSLPRVNPAAVKGRWIRAEDFTKGKFGTASFHIPEKQNWAVDPKHAQEWVSFSEARAAMTEKLSAKKSLMYWMKTGNGKFERFFVVWW